MANFILVNIQHIKYIKLVMFLFYFFQQMDIHNELSDSFSKGVGERYL